MSIFNYLLITQETLLACLLCAQVFSSQDVCLERMGSPWDSTLTPQPPPQVLMAHPQPFYSVTRRVRAQAALRIANPEFSTLPENVDSFCPKEPQDSSV